MHKKKMSPTEEPPLSIESWGPCFWKTLHTATFAYPDTPTHLQKEGPETCFRNLRHVLPCPSCQEHYRQTLATLPVDATNKDTLSRWLVEVHNRVNEQNGKPIMDYDTVRRHYLENSCELPSSSKYVQHLEERLYASGNLNMTLVAAVMFLLIICVVATFRKR